MAQSKNELELMKIEDMKQMQNKFKVLKDNLIKNQ